MVAYISASTTDKEERELPTNSFRKRVYREKEKGSDKRGGGGATLATGEKRL